MALELVFRNKGEENIIPINADNLNLIVNAINDLDTRTQDLDTRTQDLDTRTQYISSDANGTHINSATYANGYEIITDDEFEDPSTITEEELLEEPISEDIIENDVSEDSSIIEEGE